MTRSAIEALTPAPHTTSRLLLSTEGLSYRYGNRQVLRDVALRLNTGELLGIVGPNGAGKSTFLKLLAGLLPPSTGDVKLHDKSLTDYTPAVLAKQRSYLAQGAPMHWPLTAKHVVELGRLPHAGFIQRLTPTDHKAVCTAIDQAEIAELLERPITHLSEGERMRVMFARLLATEAPLMLADEPTAALDLYHQHHTLGLFKAHCRRGGSAVLVLHDLNLAARYCDKLLLLHQGHVVAHGTPTETLTEETIAQAYRMQARVTMVDGAPQIWVSPQT